jgi:hypothetical protein
MAKLSWANVGDLQQRVSSLEGMRHENQTLRSRLDTLEHTVRSLRSEVDGLVSRVQAMEQGGVACE